jgi:hypothetical protein
MKKRQKIIPGVEITTFRLNGYTCEVFIAANADIDEWLLRQPGFQSRHIAEQPDGTILDILHWDTVTAGTNAMTNLMNEMANSAVHEMIDQGTVSWNVYPVRHQVAI